MDNNLNNYLEHVILFSQLSGMDYIDSLFCDECKIFYENSRTGGNLKTSFDNIKNTVKTALTKREDLPPKERKLIQKHGHEIIQSITIGRTPVQSVISSTINLFTNGKLNKEFDSIFHLYLIIKTESNNNYSLEKNEVVKFSKNPKSRGKGEELRPVSNVPQNISLNDLFDNTIDVMGRSFFMYDAVNNNCQNFLFEIFKANNIGNNDDKQFIKQDTEDVFKKSKYLKKFMLGVTNLGASVDVIMHGAGFKLKK